MFRKNLSLFFIIVFVFSPLNFNPYSLIWASNEEYDQWNGHIRPGFLTREGSTVGYMDYFLPLWQDENDLLFFNPKVSLSDDDANEQNIGVGFRHLFGNWILGGNVFYDTRQSTYLNRFQQVGGGLEALSKWVDVRVNYYHPTTGARSVGSRDSGGATFSFGQTNLLSSTPTLELIEEPLRGVDYEVGVLVPWVSDYMETRVYGGGFFYDSKKFDNVQGSRLRVEVRPNRLITLEMKTDYPKDGGTDLSFGGYVVLPFEVGNIFKGKNPFAGWKDALGFKQGPRSVRERMTERVVRDIDIVSSVEEVKGADRVVEVQEGIFVDNSNDGDPAEDGTLSHPYNTLAEALADGGLGAGEFIYVFQGDGTAVGYTGNFTLPDNVTLWGSSVDLGFTGLSTTSGNPIIDGGGGGSVITLGNNDTVAGLTIQNGTAGIRANNKTGNTIQDNTIQSNSFGLHFDATGGSTTSNFTISGNTISSNTSTGVYIYESSSPISNFTFTGNTISSNGSHGMHFYTNGNTVSGFTFTGNTISSNTEGGVYFYGSGGTTISDFTFTSNVITGNQFGIDVMDIDINDFVLGDATTGEGGNNSIFGNTFLELDESSGNNGTIKAENNWWGVFPPVGSEFSGNVDRDPALTSDPN